MIIGETIASGAAMAWPAAQAGGCPAAPEEADPALAILHGPHWLSAFTAGAGVPAFAQRVMTHERVVALRESCLVADLFRRDRFARRWIFSRDMLKLLGLMLLHSRMVDGQCVARIGEDRLLQAFGNRWAPLRRRLHYASQEGYVAVARYGREDGPYMRIIVLPPLLAEVESIAHHAMAYCDGVGGVPLGLQDFAGEARWQAIQVCNLMLVGMGVRLRNRGLQTDCINFFFTIFDLYIHGPGERMRFARQQAKRTGVSLGTSLAVIGHAKATGWVVEDETLHLTPMALERIRMALAVIGARAQAVGGLLARGRAAGALPVLPEQVFPPLPR